MYLAACGCILEGMDSGEPWRLGHRPGLDGLRGLAILLVLVAHTFPAGAGAAGSVGVTLFFTLSGFLITALLLGDAARTGRPSMRQFYLRRARRLLPALVPFLAAATLLDLHFGLDPSENVFFVVAYASNWAMAFGHPMGLLSHTWSLAVEEQFYLIWPALVAIAVARWMTGRRLAQWCMVGAFMSFVLGPILWLAGATDAFLGASTVTRADSLLVGCALAAGLHSGWRPGWRTFAVSAGSVGLVVATGWVASVPAGLIIPTVTTVAAVPVLLIAIDSPRLLTALVLRWLGRHSYALYLWHYLLLFPTSVGWWAAPAWLDLVLAFAAAEVSWWLVERPFLRGRDHATVKVRPVYVAA